MDQINQNDSSHTPDTNNENAWARNPALGGIDPSKLQMLMGFADQAKGKNQNELLPFLMSAVSQAQDQNVSFQSSEMDAIINAIKAGKSPEQIQKIDRLCAILKRYRR